MRSFLFFLTLFSLYTLFLPFSVTAQELYQDLQETIKAEVLEVLSDEMQSLPGLDVEARVQTLRVEFLNGSKQGGTAEILNDFNPVELGDRLYINYFLDIDGRERYIVQDVDRTRALMLLIGLFVAAVILFGGWQGVRSLLALAGSFFLIFYLLFPQLLAGTSPVLAGSGIAILILAVALYVTHGFNRTASAALLGTIITIVLAALFAEFAVTLSHLSGFAEEASVYLNLSSRGAIDLRGILLAAIIIGVLGVLDDVAITQAAAVKEIAHAAPHASKKDVFTRAMRIGREHVGALVNTLALAYTGAALPLLLLFFTSTAPFSHIVNREIFAVEIVRTVAGSIAIILSVPITTLISIWLLKDRPDASGPTHSHSHMH